MMIPKTYEILDRCIDEGISFGYARAFKHTDAPSEAAIHESIHREVMNQIHEYFEFKGVDDEVKD
jgi:hypothetical protein